MQRYKRVFLNLEPAFAAVLYIVVMTMTSRFWNVYQYNVDEGFNLMKAALLGEGYSLYTQVWSDQPPIFTVLLLPLHWVAPGNVTVSRFFVLFLAGWIIFSLFRIVARSAGRDAAWLAVLALAGTTIFHRTSISILIGLPAIAFALAGIDHALAGARSGARWRFFLAGALFGLGLQTKFFVALALPAAALAPFVQRQAAAGAIRRAITDTLILLGSVAATVAVIALTFDEPLTEQLVGPHAAARTVDRFADHGGYVFVLKYLEPYWLFVPAVLGLLAALRYRRLADMLPLVWLLTAYAVLGSHRPFWYHQSLLMLVPLAWLTGLGVTIAMDPARRRMLAFAAILGVGLATAHSLYTLKQLPIANIKYLNDSPLLARNAEFRGWAITDQVMDAYRAKWLVPPELAVYSHKRRETGRLTDAYVAELIEKYQPEEVIIRRFQPSAAIMKKLRQSYVPAPGMARYVHAIRKSNLSSSRKIARDELVAAVTVSAADLVSRSAQGGFPGHVDIRTGHRYARTRKGPMGPDEILVRPPGSTQEVGQCMRQMYHLTGDEIFLNIAVSAGQALSCAQRHGGGWSSVARLIPPCGAPRHADGVDDRKRPMTLDDRATPSAIDFLMDIDTTMRKKGEPSPEWLMSAIDQALNSLINAQAESGGWPQTFPPRPGSDYSSHLTFNDGAIPSAIRTLLGAFRRYGNDRYLDAARRGGEFILATQGPVGQAGWAQQYGADLKPAAARAFEPVGFSSRETGDVMHILLDLFKSTGDERYLKAVRDARSWLEQSTIRPNVWARLYEIGTNRPIYGDRDGSIHYALSEISLERQKGYEWEGSFRSVITAFARDDALRAGDMDTLKAFDLQAEKPRAPTEEEMRKVAELVGQASAEGRWREGGHCLDTDIRAELRTPGRVPLRIQSRVLKLT